MTHFSSDAIGVETEENTFLLEADAGIEYARATNDPIHSHLTGEIIPPIYAVVPVWAKVFEVVSKVVPEEHFFSIVHGEQDMIFHSVMKPGMTLKNSAVGESISVKDSGTTLVVKAKSVDGDSGELIVEQYFTMFFRGVDGGESVGKPHSSGLDVEQYAKAFSQDLDPSSVVGEVTAHMDQDQTTRYASASGDFMPIHLDDDFAKSVGLPGIIIHGLCTMANASWAAIQTLCDGETSKLARMSLRFSKPLLPGDDLVTKFINQGDITLFQSTKKSDDSVVLSNAYVQVRG